MWRKASKASFCRVIGFEEIAPGITAANYNSYTFLNTLLKEG